ncbi:MAG: class I SAM-dependent methyltransferase [Deltaproteobacteria bacterium]|nr:class I SAM-dependent methyltransferase [Deltaproteobacteria bacterium]
MTAKKPACFICRTSLDKMRVFHEGDGQPIGLYSCGQCRSEMFYPQPSDELLMAEYRNYYSRRTRFTGEPFAKEAFFKDLLAANPSVIPGKKAFDALELGSGEGDFVKAFNSLYPGASITAVEMNAEGAENFKKLKCRHVAASIEDFLGSCRESYDVIFMFDVLEHLRSPVDTLACAASLLRPGGKICLTAPLAGSGLHRLAGRLWPQYKLEHLFYCSKEAFVRMGGRLGLTVREVSPLSKKLPISYLLSVGYHFGPRAFSKITACVTRLMPRSLYESRISLPFGEAFVVYEKKD